MDNEQARFNCLEREYLEPPDIDETLPYDDWWYTLEDLECDEMIQERICRNE